MTPVAFSAPTPSAPSSPARLDSVEHFFTALLVLCSILITWFGIYAIYRLINDES
ncbi:hypothetical protein nbrc107697_09010 [Gordonia crocea]|uniref:Uncharacterized protein n=1 Tax=Gordonia crocea TaxID=589162 RepID=A0A7I9UV86_9ACTN|nr:hypothetical protein nbrc107697_09010 [Gordonia crocea]